MRRLVAERRRRRGSVREPEEAKPSRLVEAPKTIVRLAYTDRSYVQTMGDALWKGSRGCSLANSEDGEDGGELGMDITDGEMWDKWWEWECVKMRVAVLQ